MSANKSGVVRVAKRDSSYTIIDPYFLSDERLSWKAKGLLSYLLSKPANWRVYVSDLVKRSKDGKDAVYSALKELEAAGYIERHQTRENGRITGYETVVYERPAEPLPENPDMDDPNAGNPPLDIIDLNNIDLQREGSKSAHTEDNAILHALAAALRRLPLTDTASLYDFHFADVYQMLTRRFPGRLDLEVIALASDRYFAKAYDLQAGRPRSDVRSPVGLFHDAYAEALAEYKAVRYRRKVGG